MNVAHVFSCGQMKRLISSARDNWDAAASRKLKEFVNWLFWIDTEAVVQGYYLTGNTNSHIPFKKLLEDSDLGDGYWWEEIHGKVFPNKNKLEYDNAIRILDTHFSGQNFPVDADGVTFTWANNLLEVLNNAPSNLRYGDKETNSNVVMCMVDPIGNANGYPTTKECQMIRINNDGYLNLRNRYENVPNAKQPYKYYGGQLPIRSNSPNGYGQFYSSTGMFKKEAKDTKGTPLHIAGNTKNRKLEELFYSNEPPTLNDWTTCVQMKPNPDWNFDDPLDFQAYPNQQTTP